MSAIDFFLTPEQRKKIFSGFVGSVSAAPLSDGEYFVRMATLASTFLWEVGNSEDKGIQTMMPFLEEVESFFDAAVKDSGYAKPKGLVHKADGPKPGVDAPKQTAPDEAHTLLAQLQEALQAASTAAAAIVGLLEGYERKANDATAKLDRLREFLRKEGGE